MDLVLEVRNKYLDKILVPYGNIFQCLGGYFVPNIWDIRFSGVDKVFDTITLIVD